MNLISHPIQEVGKTVPCSWCYHTCCVSVGTLRIFSEWMPCFRQLCVLFRSVVPLVTVGWAHGAFPARSLLRSAGRCSLQVAAFLDRLCGWFAPLSAVDQCTMRRKCTISSNRHKKPLL